MYSVVFILKFYFVLQITRILCLYCNASAWSVRASQLCLKCWIFGAVLILNALSPQHPAHARLFLVDVTNTQKTLIRKYTFSAVIILHKSSSSFKSWISSALLLLIEIAFLMLTMIVYDDGRQLDELVTQYLLAKCHRIATKCCIGWSGLCHLSKAALTKCHYDSYDWRGDIVWKGPGTVFGKKSLLYADKGWSNAL